MARSLNLCMRMAGSGSADDCCHRQSDRRASRFRGAVRAVRPRAEGATDVYFADSPPSFAVVITVDSVEAETTEPTPGQRLTFAMHSPARTFRRSGSLIGRTFDLQAERFDCGGKFNKFITLERRWPTPHAETYH